jgi:hypothetical protein
MPASSSTNWVKGFSENPDGELLHAKSIIEMLDRIGDELVRPPSVGAIHESPLQESPLMTRREMLWRVIWTRALIDADLAAIKLLLEYVYGKPGEAETTPADGPVFTADDYVRADMLVREGLGHDRPALS